MKSDFIPYLNKEGVLTPVQEKPFKRTFTIEFPENCEPMNEDNLMTCLREVTPEEVQLVVEDITDETTPSEAIYAFAAWLSTRKESVCIGGLYEVPPMPELVDEFCKSQGFEKPRNDYTNFLRPYPKE